MRGQSRPSDPSGRCSCATESRTRGPPTWPTWSPWLDELGEAEVRDQILYVAGARGRQKDPSGRHRDAWPYDLEEGHSGGPGLDKGVWSEWDAGYLSDLVQVPADGWLGAFPNGHPRAERRLDGAKLAAARPRP